MSRGKPLALEKLQTRLVQWEAWNSKDVFILGIKKGKRRRDTNTIDEVDYMHEDLEDLEED